VACVTVRLEWWESWLRQIYSLIFNSQCRVREIEMAVGASKTEFVHLVILVVTDSFCCNLSLMSPQIQLLQTSKSFIFFGLFGISWFRRSVYDLKTWSRFKWTEASLTIDLSKTKIFILSLWVAVVGSRGERGGLMYQKAWLIVVSRSQQRSLESIGVQILIQFLLFQKQLGPRFKGV
jgi:hypothetical protein